jgi:N-acyl-L-homoserine lactone synthetase
MLFVVVIEWALASDIDELSVQCDPSFAPAINAFGASARLLAKPSLTSENQAVAPILVQLRPPTPQTMQTLFGMASEALGRSSSL